MSPSPNLLDPMTRWPTRIKENEKAIVKLTFLLGKLMKETGRTQVVVSEQEMQRFIINLYAGAPVPTPVFLTEDNGTIKAGLRHAGPRKTEAAKQPQHVRTRFIDLEE